MGGGCRLRDDDAVVLTGPLLRELRTVLGLSQTDVGRAAQLDLATLCRVEAGQIPLSPAMTQRLRRAIAAAVVTRAGRLAEQLRTGPVARPVASRRS